MAKKAQNDADGMLAAILEGLKPALKSAFENFSFVGEAGADEPKKKYGGVKNADARRGRDFGDKEAKDFEGKYGGIKNAPAGTSGTGKDVTAGVMGRAREDDEMNKLYEDRFKDATPAAPSGARGKMFDTTQLPKEAFPKASAPKDPGEGAMASAGRLLYWRTRSRAASGRRRSAWGYYWSEACGVGFADSSNAGYDCRPSSQTCENGTRRWHDARLRHPR